MIDTRPIAYDICCGLGGWTEALLDEGYRVIGFDVEAHDYGTGGYPGELLLRDITTIHGSELKDATLIVCSPPCQRYSYMAMPWSRAKAQAAMIEADTTGGELRKLNLLFDTCFRLQREASEAAGHHIPMIVENVRGAQKWVGRAAYHYGSFYLWGDVPALMPIIASRSALKVGVAHRPDGETNFHGHKTPGRSLSKGSPNKFGTHNMGAGDKMMAELGVKADGFGWTYKGSLASHNRLVANTGVKVPGIKLSDVGFNVAVARKIDPSQKPDGFAQTEDMKRQHIGYSRKAASAMIAKIPYPLALHIARIFKPR